MATEAALELGLADQRLAQRLDALDQLLIGALPRHERQAVMADLENRMRAWHARPVTALDAEPVSLLETLSGPRTPGPGSPASYPLMTFHSSGPTLAGTRPPRSTAAFVAGIAGIVACGLLFLFPLVYLLAVPLSEMIDETFAIGGLAAYGGLIALAGGTALLLGAIGLWRSRASTGKRGRGWAIAGLCLGPVPFGLTTAALLMTALSLFGSVTTYSTSDGVPVSGGPENVPLPPSAHYLAPPPLPPGVQPQPSNAYGSAGVIPAGAVYPASVPVNDYGPVDVPARLPVEEPAGIRPPAPSLPDEAN